jgi:hypothetical protein
MLLLAEPWEEFTMNIAGSSLAIWPSVFRKSLAVTILLSSAVGATGAFADEDDIKFQPGNLLLSRSVYDNNPANVVAGTTLLPPNCVAPNCATATDNGQYPFVFGNDAVDGSFGITSKILLDQLEPSGKFINSLQVELRSIGTSRFAIRSSPASRPNRKSRSICQPMAGL